jgi:hypothetical protein
LVTEGVNRRHSIALTSGESVANLTQDGFDHLVSNQLFRNAW